MSKTMRITCRKIWQVRFKDILGRTRIFKYTKPLEEYTGREIIYLVNKKYRCMKITADWDYKKPVSSEYYELKIKYMNYSKITKYYKLRFKSPPKFEEIVHSLTKQYALGHWAYKILTDQGYQQGDSIDVNNN